jgi:3'-phosphoadenosine 5'-phosphosulfate sulfotransferase
MTTGDRADPAEWQRKGATLSDKTASKEFGLTHDAIVAAIRAGKLQCRRNSAHGNPFLRLLRREVEALVKQQQGDDYLTIGRGGVS